MPFAVLGAGPSYKRDLSSLILRYKSLNGLDEKLSAYSITKHYGVDDEIEPLVKSLGGYYIREYEFFCTNGICRNILPDGIPLVFDQHHLTLTAANLLGTAIRKEEPFLFEKLTKNK